MSNQFHQLRRQLIAESTRPFQARGMDVKRCNTCLLRVDLCLCEVGKTMSEGLNPDFDFVLLMHKKETYKPTNTGRLLVDLFPNNSHVFCWSRQQPQPELLALLEDPKRSFCILFPGDEDDERVSSQWQHSGPEDNRRKTFIILDGTWKQARRMFNLSPYLAKLPVLALDHNQVSTYLTRQAAHEHYLSTAESVGLALQQSGDQQSATAVLKYYGEFNRRYGLLRANKSL